MTTGNEIKIYFTQS